MRSILLLVLSLVAVGDLHAGRFGFSRMFGRNRVGYDVSAQAPAMQQDVEAYEVQPAADEAVVFERLLALHNQYRASSGLPALRLNPTLCRASRFYADVLARRNEYGHYLRGTHWDRARAFGFRYPTQVCENLCWTYADADAAVTAWWNSSGHRDNVLSDCDCVGFGYRPCPMGGFVWVAMYGVSGGDEESPETAATTDNTP